MPEFEENHPMIRGRLVHTQIEEYICGSEEEFPAVAKRLKETIDFCKDMYQQGKATAEDQWGFDEDWNSVGWFDDKVWFRCATDAFVTPDDSSAIIYDWKTGKSFGNEVKYMQQMQVYAVAAFMRYPNLELIDVHLGFVDDSKIRTKTFKRGKKITRLLSSFTGRAKNMTDAHVFKPKANMMNCKWCPFGPSGTNVCIHGVEPL